MTCADIYKSAIKIKFIIKIAEMSEYRKSSVLKHIKLRRRFNDTSSECPFNSREENVVLLRTS